MSIMHSSGTTGRPKAVTQTHASSVAGRLHERTVAVGVVRIGGSDVAVEKLLRAANEVLQAANHPTLAVLEVAVTDADFPVGVTGKALKRQLREKYRDLASYLREPGRILAAATESTS